MSEDAKTLLYWISGANANNGSDAESDRASGIYYIWFCVGIKERQ